MRPGLLVCSGLLSRAPERHPQIDAAVLAERRDRLARPRVDGGEVAGVEVEEPPVRAVRALPVVHARGRRSRPGSGCVQISFPVAASSATMALPVPWTYITPSTTSGLNVMVPVDRIGPGHLELRHVRLVDFLERAELRGVRATAVGFPGRVGLVAGPAVASATPARLGGQATRASVAQARMTATDLRIE